MTTRSFKRRSVLRAGFAGALSLSAFQAVEGASNAAPHVAIAGYEYDRVRAISDGSLGLEGLEVRFREENIYGASVQAFGPEKKYHVTEIGLIPFIRQYVNKGFRAYTLLPIFISRTFRHRNIFVHAESGIEKPEDLKGRVVGTPGYAFSANTWIRGFLLDEYGVAADDMEWIETTASSDGMPMQQGLDRHYLPVNFPLRKGPPEIDESELLIQRGCDALITAITPRAYLEADPRIRRLFRDVREAETRYYRDNRVFPIMHAIAVRTDVVEDNPWLPRALFRLYCDSKQAAYSNLETTTALQVSLPWITQEFEETRELMGTNYWPYGIEANRKELELVMRYVYEQGLTKHAIDFEDIFHESTLTLIDN